MLLYPILSVVKSELLSGGSSFCHKLRSNSIEALWKSTLNYRSKWRAFNGSQWTGQGSQVKGDTLYFFDPASVWVPTSGRNFIPLSLTVGRRRMIFFLQNFFKAVSQIFNFHPSMNTPVQLLALKH